MSVFSKNNNAGRQKKLAVATAITCAFWSSSLLGQTQEGGDDTETSPPAVCQVPSFGDDLRFAKKSVLKALYQEQSFNDAIKISSCGCPLIMTAEEFADRNFDGMSFEIVDLKSMRNKQQDERALNLENYIGWYRNNCKDK